MPPRAPRSCWSGPACSRRRGVSGACWTCGPRGTCIHTATATSCMSIRICTGMSIRILIPPTRAIPELPAFAECHGIHHITFAPERGIAPVLVAGLGRTSPYSASRSTTKGDFMFERLNSKRLSWTGTVAAALLAFIAGNAAAEPGAELAQRYVSSIHQAAVPEESVVATDLIPVVRSNDGLVWEGAGPDARVRVVSWMSEKTFQNYYANPQELPADKRSPASWGALMWVTTVPQVKNFCRALKPDAQTVTLRLKQLLGLPPERDYQRFVELWVSPKDLSRPCADPDITTRSCGVQAASAPATDNASVEFRNWFR